LGSFANNELQNNRHTFQSWRDHWIKYVSQHARPIDADASPAPSDGPALVAKAGNRAALQKNRTERHVSQPHRAPASTSRAANDEPVAGSVTGSKSSKSRVAESPSANPWVAKSAGGLDFSQKEIQLLVDFYDDIVNIDEDKAIDAWAAWALQVGGRHVSFQRFRFLTLPIIESKSHSTRMAKLFYQRIDSSCREERAQNLKYDISSP
jgi:hypothetical protein